MRMRSEARLTTGEPSLPLSQRIRATTRQRPAPTRVRRGTQWNVNRPFRPVRAVPIRNAFCELSS